VKMMGKPLLLSLMLILLWAVPVGAQDANAPQDALPQTYTEIAMLGRGKVLEARWRSDGQAFLVSTHLGGWLYSADLTLLHHFPGIGQSALSADGRFVATVTVTPYQLRIWDAQTYEITTAFDLGVDPEWKKDNVLAWSPDSAHIAVVADKTLERQTQSVEIFNVISGQHARSFEVESYITHLSWRPDGQRLAISQRGPVLIIDPFHDQPDTTVSIDTGSSMTLWSPDQQMLATLYIDNGYGGMENNLKLWSGDGKTLKLVIQESITTSLAWSPDSRMLATGMRSPGFNDPPYYSATFWDRQTGEMVGYLSKYEGSYRKRFLSVEWSADGNKILTASDDNVVHVYDWPLRRQRPRELVAGQDPITSLAWNGDGTQIVSSSADGNALIQDVATGAPLDRLEAPQPRLKSVAWNSLTNQIAFGTNANAVYTWDIGAVEPLGMRSSPRDDDGGFPEIAVVAYSPDGQWLASAASDYPISLWLTDNSDNTRTLGPVERAVFSLSWSGDSRKLAYNSDLAHVYDLESETTKSFECASNDITSSVALSPDGRYLAAANVSDGMRIWDIDTQTLMTNWPVLEAMNTGAVSIGDIQWHPDGKSLALVNTKRHMDAGSEIREWFVEVWSMPGGELLASMQTKASLTDIAWSPDGARLAAGDSNGLIHIWQQP
jgi:WD40 repeat protein